MYLVGDEIKITLPEWIAYGELLIKDYKRVRRVTITDRVPSVAAPGKWNGGGFHELTDKQLYAWFMWEPTLWRDPEDIDKNIWDYLADAQEVIPGRWKGYATRAQAYTALSIACLAWTKRKGAVVCSASC